MNAVFIRQHSQIADLKVSDVPAPSPADGEVLVKVEAAGINPSDVGSVMGRFAHAVLPRIVGRDFADRVTEGPADLIGEPTRPTRAERFKAVPELRITLNHDPNLDVVEQHSDQQTVVRGQRHREWRWSVWPKTVGPHELTLLVRGVVNGKSVEDYDPEIKEYDAGINLKYWFLNGLFLNGISWAWAVVLLVLTNATTIFVTNKANKRKHKQSRRK
jgi:hypothetical protein